MTCSTFTCLINLYDLLHLHHLCHIEIDPSIRLGKRLFGTSAAKLWNELPRNIQRADSITMLKKLFKTLIFFSIRSMCIW